MTSVLFADIVSFTPLSESRDAEDVRELLSEYFARCRTIVSRYGGTIEKFIGDAVMAVWGVPIAHEDDAERAVRTGLELTQAIAEMGAEVGAPGLAIRVGVVTGEVAVTVGATAEGMVTGDAVNTAARIQSVADPGHVWVDATTRSLTSSVITYEDRGDHELKGKAEPQHLFAAGGVISAPDAQRPDGLQAPLTGREAESRQLKELFHRTDEANRPHLVILEGEAGTGKSRLAREFEVYVEGLAVQAAWHRGRCLSYGDGVAFWALAEALRPRLGLLDEEPTDESEPPFERRLAEIVTDPDERAWLRPRLATLLGLPVESTFTREDLFASWTTFLERTGGGHSVVLIVDDAQYADDGLLDFVDHLLGTARSAIFVVALTRPELLDRRADWGTDRATTIRLGPLGDDAMARLVDGLVDGLPHTARAALVSRADGIPLYAVETIRALVDRDEVVQRDGRYVLADPAALDLSTIGAPASLHALVAARLDALSPEERLVVTHASVLGMAFTRDALLSMESTAGMDGEQLDVVLESLQRKEILGIQQDRFSADRGQFRFVQGVVRQVAYATQSKRDRKARHLAAESYLASLPDDSGDLTGLRAQHLLDAYDASSPGDTDTDRLTAAGVALLERAAQRATQLGAPGDALRHLQSARRHVTDPAEDARLKVAAANVANEAGQYEQMAQLASEAAAYYDSVDRPIDAGLAVALQGSALMSLQANAAAIDLCRARWDALDGMPGAEVALARLAGTLASTYHYRGDQDAAGYFAERRLELAQALNDPSAIALAEVMLGIRYATLGAPMTARSLYLSSAQVARDNNLGVELATALVNLVTIEMCRDLQAARAQVDEAVATARRCGSATFTAYAAGNLALILWVSGELDELESLLADVSDTVTFAAMRLSTTCIAAWLADARGRPLSTLPEALLSDAEPDRAWMGNLELAHALAAGDAATAARLADETLEPVVASAGLEDDFMHLWPPLVDAALAAGDVDLAERLMRPVADAPDDAISPAVRAHFLRLRGLVAAARGAASETVEADLRAGAEALADFGAVGLSGRAHESLGRWLASIGRDDEAQTALTQARRAYEQIGATGWLNSMVTLG